MSLLAYADDGLIHLTNESRKTLCGQDVYYVPELPHGGIAPLSCETCYALEQARLKEGAL